MDPGPELRYDPEVDRFGSRILETKTGQRITYEEAFKNRDIVNRALQIPAIDVPMEFTMFVLRKMAVAEKDFHRFAKVLPHEAREYLGRLLTPNRVIPRDIHYCYEEHHSHNSSCCNENQPPSTFRAAFIKVFCKKVLANSKNLEDHHFDKLAAIFPFQVSHNVMGKYKIEVLKVFDDDFYNEIQWFLNQHFDDVNARDICALFLNNICHCMATTFSIDQLMSRKKTIPNADRQNVDYLSIFPRLNDEGIEWIKFLYWEFTEVANCFDFPAPVFREQNDDEYFRNLPENNFADLYSFLEFTFYFQKYRPLYTHRFKKYLFFFVHALKINPNPVFFIDDILFECLQSLRRYKKLNKDIDMVKDLAKISLLQVRLFAEIDESFGRYSISGASLQNIRTYLTESIIPGNPRLNVVYKTDLITWMPIRTEDTCFNIGYSGRRMHGIKDFIERVLCSVLCPDDDPIKYIVSYNAFRGVEGRYAMPENIESIRNFIRLCNTYDVTDESLEDDFLREFISVIKTERKVDQYIYAYFGLFDKFEGMI